ncbi:MAG: hypothetical protein JW773_07060 [Desulfuromonadales bacterium]|nr:hypothetical protein [Desulfuromonadales bacterium]
MWSDVEDIPILCPKGLMKRLAWYKLVKGFTFEQLGEEMGRDPEQHQTG